ncbi:glucuronate isomerase [Oscillatoria laete-virens NRMC-F 0139]|nr:glucuronate isomerase [Oscillatoria laete-virens NRMC-F 0139]
MSVFIHEDFLLQNQTARALHHEVARDLPIIDYHSHLPPEQIARGRKFKNLTEAWLAGDHYKWRLMRANGIGEKYCTGDASDYEKFQAFLTTLDYAVGSPVYHWAALELKRFFRIDELPTPGNAKSIWDTANARLQDMSIDDILAQCRVETICTTDDPLSDLAEHTRINASGFPTAVYPTYRPDMALPVGNLDRWREWIARLEKVTGANCTTLEGFLKALKSRHDFFAQKGCRLSDHGMPNLPQSRHSEDECSTFFTQLKEGQKIPTDQRESLCAFLMGQFALWDHGKEWIKQLHLGVVRNQNHQAFSRLGPDTGFDTMGDSPQLTRLSAFFNQLEGKIPRTILYNLNPSDTERFAAFTGVFQDGLIPGKIQYGAAWWFLDNHDGILAQLAAVSTHGLLGRFVGMLTDSRSFLSFVRHEYFRRILCNWLGAQVENGFLPHERDLLQRTVEGICYRNAREYFRFPHRGGAQ